MKPLVTTVRAVSELATGLSPDAVSTSEVLFEFSTPEIDFLIAADDDEGIQRIVMIREQSVNDPYVPDHLVDLRRDVLSRMASFAERAKASGPLSLPRQWHQYKHHNYVAFFVTPKHDMRASRWIAEVSPSERADIIFWSSRNLVARQSLGWRPVGRKPSQPPRNTSSRRGPSHMTLRCTFRLSSSQGPGAGLTGNG
jgi:hypothetical protein